MYQRQFRDYALLDECMEIEAQTELRMPDAAWGTLSFDKLRRMAKAESWLAAIEASASGICVPGYEVKRK